MVQKSAPIYPIPVTPTVGVAPELYSVFLLGDHHRWTQSPASLWKFPLLHGFSAYLSAHDHQSEVSNATSSCQLLSTYTTFSPCYCKSNISKLNLISFQICSSFGGSPTGSNRIQLPRLEIIHSWLTPLSPYPTNSKGVVCFFLEYFSSLFPDFITEPLS